MSIVNLPLHTRLTPDEVLEIVKRRNPEKLIVLFVERDNPKECIVNSAMTREECLWLAEVLRLHTLGLRE